MNTKLRAYAVAAGVLVPLAGVASAPSPANAAPASKVATTLTADGVIIPNRPPATGSTGRFTAHLARRSNGRPLSARRIVLRIDGAWACAARTAEDGSAVCTTTNKALQNAAASDGFDARFAGDADFKASSAHGKVSLAP